MKKNLAVISLSFSLLFTLSSNSVADAQSRELRDTIVSNEYQFINAFEKLLSFIPRFRDALSQVTAPEEHAQFIRGLEELHEEIGYLLESKQRIIASLSGGTREEQARLREQARELNRMEPVFKALAFIDPKHFPKTFRMRSGSNENGTLRDLRQDFYMLEEEIKKTRVEKDTATLLIYGETSIAPDDIPRILKALKASESSLRRSRTVVRQVLTAVNQ
ncbi:MAG: hypothetical protein H0X43_14105 [Nitrosospira sp.]|nr:hypothetical protein [Nitrosospira sp.]